MNRDLWVPQPAGPLGVIHRRKHRFFVWTRPATVDVDLCEVTTSTVSGPNFHELGPVLPRMDQHLLKGGTWWRERFEHRVVDILIVHKEVHSWFGHRPPASKLKPRQSRRTAGSNAAQFTGF